MSRLFCAVPSAGPVPGLSAWHFAATLSLPPFISSLNINQGDAAIQRLGKAKGEGAIPALQMDGLRERLELDKGGPLH